MCIAMLPIKVEKDILFRFIEPLEGFLVFRTYNALYKDCSIDLLPPLSIFLHFILPTGLCAMPYHAIHHGTIYAMYAERNEVGNNDLFVLFSNISYIYRFIVCPGSLASSSYIWKHSFRFDCLLACLLNKLKIILCLS